MKADEYDQRGFSPSFRVANATATLMELIKVASLPLLLGSKRKLK